MLFFWYRQGNLKEEIEELRRGVKKMEKMILTFLLHISWWDNKNPVSKNSNKWRVFTTDPAPSTSLLNEKWKRGIVNVLSICNLLHPEMNKEAFPISRLRVSVSVCHIQQIYRLFVNRKDWFTAFPFNDGITVSWKLEPRHPSLTGNRPCTIKWSVTTCH